MASQAEQTVCKTTPDEKIQSPDSLMHPANNTSKSSLTKWEIDRKSVTFVKKLSSGQLCEEWQGLLNKKADVVIKTLKEGVITVADLLQEAQSLSSLCHPKIIALQAVSTLEEPIYIITELMEHGSLQDYLRKDSQSLKEKQLISMTAQVAEGMAYLESQSFIHCDLRAQNVKVGKNLLCKVAGFSMAKQMDVYMAPEDFKVRIYAYIYIYIYICITN